MLTEIEYIKCLQENSNSVTNMNESSFFKSFINVEKAARVSKEEERIKAEEIHALRDINEQLKKKITDLTKQVDELEQENNHLSNEHLAILKKQENMLKKTEEQSTLDDTENNRVTLANSVEEMAQVISVKDK